MNAIAELTGQLVWLLIACGVPPLVIWVVRLVARNDARRRYKQFYEDRDD
jgi:hypothetical protein